MPRALVPLIATLTAIVLCAAPLAATTAAFPAAERTSLPTIERQVMCVSCKIPLNVAQSPQADRERAYIQSLIDQGDTEPQIKDALVSQYGSAVLGLPAASGFDLTAYLVPVIAVLALIVLLVLLLPRWRRRARAQAALGTAATALDAADEARLDADLARFD